MPFYVYVLLFVQISGMAAGQIFTKIGMDQVGAFGLNTLPQIITNPWLWGGLLAYGGASGLWMWLLTKGDFSALVPFQSLSMALAVVGAFFIFHEDISMVRWIGIIIMSIGAFMVAK